MRVARADEGGYVSDKLRVRMKVLLRIAEPPIQSNGGVMEEKLAHQDACTSATFAGFKTTGESIQEEACVREPVKYAQRSQPDWSVS